MTRRPVGTRVLDGLAAIVGLLPRRALMPLGVALGFVAGSLLRIRRGHVERGLAGAGLPRTAAPRMYRSLGTGVFELLWITGKDRASTDDLVLLAPSAAAVLESARARGRGLVVAASHTGNWDLAACAVAKKVSLLVVTKSLRAKALDVFWQSARARHGVRLIGAQAALRRARDHVSRGGAAALMIDQVPLRARHGAEGTFLARAAWLDRAPATLAARTGAPLVVAAARRLEDGRNLVETLAVLEPPPRAGAGWIDEATREATAALDRFVREHPESWLWLHRRWRVPA